MTEQPQKPIQNERSSVRLPILLSFTLAGGILLGSSFFGGKGIGDAARGYSKFKEVLQLIDNNYVDTVNTDELVDVSIQKMLEKLDPHSSYFNAKDAVAARSQLAGGFDGIGIEFNLYKDTVYVLAPIVGGPSEAAGVQSGDKIIKVNGEVFTGKKVDNTFVFSKLRGPRGSAVRLDVLRRGSQKLLTFNLNRDRIPTFSIDAAYLLDRETGYIKVTRFSETTYEEFKTALGSLKAQGMKKLLLDLRGNPGGFMDRATNMADELLSGSKLLVYTDGKDDRYDRQTRAQFTGMFEDGPVVVMIDEGSASASEIVAGALQDHDRALIVGRRSFGKGLVQMPVNLSDGSELRLTISRYYTPSGRSIQKPYEKGHLEEYESDYKKRVQSGEFFSADSIKNNPKLQFKTSGGRTVYGGGGITPDVFAARDTSMFTNYLYELSSKNILREYALETFTKNRKKFEKMTFADFTKSYNVIENDLQAIVKEANSANIKWNEKEFNRSKTYIQALVKAFVARQVFQKKERDGLNNEFYQVMAPLDGTYQQAIRTFAQAEQLTRGNYSLKK
ncbi:MAG: PDZ domain-containing protein [Runella slithyformis]|nr:MAG: PDZ domain-containing protein [Runella slithyformis]TAF95144.1 MAG: PDZ domain-containing protein [Runella sp.]TAG20153.1 MAG: PDZ domain-containing protein [Cytophagales bacterium]TAG39262.1 MAG: PDZ domain-containing protein [Cytophagia bacterium]TAF29088.1 MAG: PDZ domain-containing protein [Runella slithyformis]